MTKLIIMNEYSKKAVVDFISGLNVEKPWDITIERPKKKRTLSQNALYWDWVTDIGDHLGYFKNDMHELLKKNHMVPKIIIFEGKEHEIKSIKNLNTREMSEYMDKVNYWAHSEMGIRLKIPADQQRNQ